ncbi:hypothetical protein HMPREF1862_01802 [Varibaculum cambriense]|uniref:Uncharacterized protein n=1 Tax=Varibaculum cambriense TaxID=184870 RepID=A0AB34WX04_9ACTO|nr:hypothetical protein HMPREF1862_01802 [Varibaculum cambriense]
MKPCQPVGLRGVNVGKVRARSAVTLRIFAYWWPRFARLD